MTSPNGLQDLALRVEALERRRGPQLALAEVTASNDAELEALRRTYNVRLLDRNFCPTGAVLEDVPVMIPHLATLWNGTIASIDPDTGIFTNPQPWPDSPARIALEGSTGSGGNPSHIHSVSPGWTPIPAGVNNVVVPKMYITLGQFVIMANVGLGADSYWVILGRLEDRAATEIRNERSC